MSGVIDGYNLSSLTNPLWLISFRSRLEWILSMVEVGFSVLLWKP